MIDGLIDIVILLAMLVGLVLVHELGHFVMAKRAGVIVHEFGIGFPPRARVLFRRGETIYTLNWLPIGGFVRLEGEEGRPGAADSADGADAEAVDADDRLLPENEAGRSLVAAAAGEPVHGDGVVRDPRAFVNQRLGTRLRILAAGVVVNFLLAWLIFTLVAMFADPVFQVRVGGVLPGSPAEAAGIQPGRIVGYTDPVPVRDPAGAARGETEQFPIYDDSGDLVVAVDGHQFPVVDEMVAGPDAVDYRFPPLRYLAERPGQAVVLTVQRRHDSVSYDEDIEVTLRPAAEAAEQGALGIEGYKVPQADMQNGLVESAVMGFERTVQASTLVLRGIGSLISSIFDGGDSEVPVSGPVGIVSIVGDIRAVAPPVFLIILAGLLSANLAVINALPFPPMDGGRFAIALLQAASRNSISPAAERLVYLTGFVLLMMLLVWVTASDVQRLFE